LKLAGLKRFPKVGKVMQLLKASRAAMHEHLDAFEKQLSRSGGPWILGEQFTLADVGFMAIFERLREADWIDYFLGNEQRPQVSAYWKRLQQRPSYQAALGNHVDEIAAKGLADLVAAKRDDPLLREALVGTVSEV